MQDDFKLHDANPIVSPREYTDTPAKHRRIKQQFLDQNKLIVNNALEKNVFIKKDNIESPCFLGKVVTQRLLKVKLKITED